MAEPDGILINKETASTQNTTTSSKNTNSLVDLGGDMLNSVKKEAQGVWNSLKSNFSMKSNEQELDFYYEEKSFENKHKDVISGILQDSFNGNLWNAGVSTINLLNTGTKHKAVIDPNIDKDLWNFKYGYLNGEIDLAAVETNGDAFLPNFDDPTILGFSIRLDFDNSPLFSDVLGASEFIQNYSIQHPEMSYCKFYREEFKKEIKEILEAPETTENYKLNGVNNYYLSSIKGLNKLDNKFVKYAEKEEEHENLELVLVEDIRMKVNKIAFLYKNLTWSYNMGKKLIPENLLRFDMYIKVSDIRKLTTDESIDSHFSRIVYEIKDCEFLFNDSMNPETLTLGGIGKTPNNEYADLTLKIKYRKVNRIYYSGMYDKNKAYIISDKFFKPNNESAMKDLEEMKFSPKNTINRKHTNNYITVEESLEAKLDRMKTEGIFKTDDDDTALNRYIKTLGNKVVKQGASIVDEGVNSVKNSLNSVNTDSLKNNINPGIVEFLTGEVAKKTSLGNLNFGNTQINPLRDSNKHPKDNSSNNLKDIKLHPDTNFTMNMGNNNLHPNPNFSMVNPNEDLHPDSNFKIENPNEDLHPNQDSKINIDDLNLHPNPNFKMENPNEDLHPIVNSVIGIADLNLHPKPNIKNETLDENLHNIVENIIDNPSENLNNGLKYKTETLDENVHNVVENIIVQPNENLNGVSEPIISPQENLNTGLNQIIEEPNEILHDKFTEFIKKPSENGLLDILDKKDK